MAWQWIVGSFFAGMVIGAGLMFAAVLWIPGDDHHG
jgi:hypothetical protein